MISPQSQTSNEGNWFSELGKSALNTAKTEMRIQSLVPINKISLLPLCYIDLCVRRQFVLKQMSPRHFDFLWAFRGNVWEQKRITSVTVSCWMLQLSCWWFWNSPFVSLGTFSPCHNLLCRYMPFSDDWEQIFLVLGECGQLSVMQKAAPLLVQPWCIWRVLLWLFTSGLWNSTEHPMASDVLEVPALTSE